MFLCHRTAWPECEAGGHCTPDPFDPIGGGDEKNAVISIDSWGNVQWKSMALFAADCKVLNKLPENSPDLSHVKSMDNMFEGAISFNQPLEHWDVSNVTSMYHLFQRASAFNQPLEKWNVSNVTNMKEMFCSCSKLANINMSG